MDARSRNRVALGLALILMTPVVAATSSTPVLAAPSSTSARAARPSPPPGRVVSIIPASGWTGDWVTLRSSRPIKARRSISVDLRNAAGRTSRLRAKRLAGRSARFRLTKSATRKLAPDPGSQTRLRARLVVDGRPGPWSRSRFALAPRPTTPPEGEPGGSPPPANPVPDLNKTVVTAADFEYLGAFAMPIDTGCGWESAWSTAGLAVRRVGGQLRFFSGAHVYSGGLIYEANYPGVSKTPGAWPEAAVVQAHCDVYRGRKRLGAAPEAFGEQNQTHGLFWDATDERLYWSFGDYYNADTSNDNVLGYSVPGTGGYSRGPWRTTDGSATHSQRVRGGTLAIPTWFADEYLGGNRLGIGFGGYYSIIGEGSMGPTLYAINPPAGDGGVIDPRPLIVHPADFGQALNWARRPVNYWIDPTINWALSPSGGRGFWAPGDSIEGAAVWIDEAEKHGLIYFAQLNLGRIAYEFGTITNQGSEPYWYVYDPARIADVARGDLQPWQVAPDEITARDYPATGDPQGPDSGSTRRVSGAAYDPTTNTLFLLQLNGRQSDWRQTPLVHAFRLNGVS